MIRELAVPWALRVLEPARPDLDERRAADAWARVVWNTLCEPGDGIAGLLIASYGPAEALERVAGTGALHAEVEPAAARAARDRWRPRWKEAVSGESLRRAARAGVSLLLPEDAAWPVALDDLGHHAPAVLWLRGRVDTPERSVALVGARAASAYGEHVATTLAADLTSEGIPIVSGAAYGIDGASHRGGLASGGPTWAVLAGGADRSYPAGHTRLIDRIAESGGVIAEVPCGSAPTKWRFLARNRLIAALTDATVIVEAGVRSGALNTAAHAASLGRPLGAVPGPVTSAQSAGPHRILREFGGECVTSAQDVREMLGIDVGDVRAATAAGELDGPVGRVLDALSARTPRSAEEVARRSGQTVAEVQSILGVCALDERVIRVDGAWRRASSTDRGGTGLA